MKDNDTIKLINKNKYRRKKCCWKKICEKGFLD